MFEAYQIGPFLFCAHAFFLLLGIALSTDLFLRTAAGDKLGVKDITDHALWYAVAFLLGARFLTMIPLYRVYVNDPLRMLVFWDGTFSFLGGSCGVALALAVFMRKQYATYLQWIDALAPAVTMGLTIEWIGRFLGNVAYGKPAVLGWGIVAESISVRYTVPIHPVQLYYATVYTALTILLLWLRKRPGRRAGSVTLIGILVGAACTILLEMLRGDFAIYVFARLSDFIFLALLFSSLGVIIAIERKISPRYSLINSVAIGIGTIAYIAVRQWMGGPTFEWRMSLFLAVLAVLGVVVYVVAHRWKYPHL